jgi:hypothetical protein
MLWMLGVSPSEAAPIARAHRGTRPLCVSPVVHHSAHARPRVKVTKPQSRDARRVVPIHLMVRRHVSGWLQRSGSRPFKDLDAAAIQSGAAVGASDDPRLRASLQPLGMLAEAQREKAVSQTVVRRAPRGPPPSPCLDSPASA